MSSLTCRRTPGMAPKEGAGLRGSPQRRKDTRKGRNPNMDFAQCSCPQEGAGRAGSVGTPMDSRENREQMSPRAGEEPRDCTG